MSKRALAVVLTMALMTGSASSILAETAQATGALGGKATDKVDAPYDRYSVRVRSVASAVIVQTATLDTLGTFSFTSIPLSQSYLVELFEVSNSKIICTEGPFALGPTVTTKTDINIDCGTNPAAWALATGAGALLVAAAVQSNSQ